MDREYEKRLLCAHENWNSVGVIRRKQRQILREWAKSGRNDYGKYSIKGYCEYLKELNWSVN